MLMAIFVKFVEEELWRLFSLLQWTTIRATTGRSFGGTVSREIAPESFPLETDLLRLDASLAYQKFNWHLCWSLG